jgi:DNA (cytosine-5)-methyltransferase 1
MTLTVGSLFTGIGGLDLGLERAGMRVLWQSEIDPYCCEVLAKHWPEVPNLGDVTAIDWQAVQPVDVICGGYPCQPFSLAGARKGTTDERHLWPYFANAIRVLRPRFALLENVAGHLTLGFGEVLRALAEIGYDAQWDCVPAAAVGAPHRRDRLFVVAYPNGDGKHDGAVNAEVASAPQPLPDGDGLRVEQISELGGRGTVVVGSDGASQLVADADSTPRSATRRASETLFRPETLERFRRRSSSDGHTWTVEPDVGRVAHGIPNRVDRLKALGNAVVPQIAHYIGELIVEHAERATA